MYPFFILIAHVSKLQIATGKDSQLKIVIRVKPSDI